ncbi:Cytochrome c oxidase assembly protein cox15 [Taxawa tesnikishii (nom. ined.)]|nr:Cytochrome c oxidase assembly protein cox15 [Dothideales sp. JES 119]
MKSVLGAVGLLQRAAPRFALEPFVCRRCLHEQAASRQAYKSLRQTPYLHAFRHFLPLGELSKNIGSNAAKDTPKKSAFPETSSKTVAYWLLGSAASVFGIVIFGGLTRLTESGSSPEFKLLNPRMTLEEFKQIYWMEWIHRLWGRVVGLTFLLPTTYFIARRRVSARMALKLTGICGLIGFQGVLGWWMVKSGLKDDLFAPGSHPRVSQYRLTAHLGTAFICYLAMVWNGLTILRENRLLANPAESQKLLNAMAHPGLRFFRRSVGALAILVFITAMSGGLVAGLDAGLIYNEFPYMGLGLTPPFKELFDPFYSHVPDHSDLWWRNPLENPSLVQLDHRILATTTFTAVMALWAYTRYNPRVRALMTTGAKKGVRGVVHLVWLQVALGISTLLYLVPVPLASAHQAGALALLTGTIVLGSRVWVPKRAARLVAQRLSQGSATARSQVGRRGPEAMLRAQTGL